jgi:electron transfer flavoprotein alpha subunit
MKGNCWHDHGNWFDDHDRPRRDHAELGMSGILVYALHYEGAFNKNSLGAVSEGARLAAELGSECHAIVVGDKSGLPDELVSTLGAYGAEKVFRVEGPEGLAQPVVDAMAQVMQAGGHGYALFGGGLLGFEIGAGLAARLDAGVCMEVTAVRVDERSGDEGRRKLVAERPILQDSQISSVHYRSGVGVIIGRLNAFETTEGGSGTAAVEDVDVEFRPHSLQAKMIQRGEQRGANVNIEDADFLVAGGRGLGKAEGFEQLEALAKALGGAVAATRAVVDAGWYSYSAQIGQTGKTVAPKLYLAAGISGAIQHKVGMQGSENIVAINKDSNAPIFEFSDLGIVGDLNKIVPKLTEAVKAKKG